MHIERKRYGDHRLIQDGKEVGRVFRYTDASGFGVQMPGIYWRDGNPTRHGGGASTSVRLLRDAVAVASRAIPLLPPNTRNQRPA